MYDSYFQKIHEECELRNRSAGTAKAYEANIRLFLKETDKTPEELTLEDARQFILAKHRSGVSASTCNFYNSSLAFFYRHVLHIFWDQEVVPRMRRDCRVPDILSIEDVGRMIDTATEIRNKALISIIYSSGLRVGEAVRLKPQDIYMSTMQVHIVDSKNHSDHWTILSKTALDYLTAYWRSYPVKRERLFVTLDEPRRPLKVSGVEIMIRQIAREADITKKVYPHLLRRSFATHLLEQGVPVEYIQTILGHKYPGSTYTYLHIANKSLMGIRNPLDRPGTAPLENRQSGGRHV